ncbi:MAG: hypothetical protein R2695_16315 [Acidimicrobiales bacterium]
MTDTVEKVAAWHGTREWPVWSWVISFWPLVVLASIGGRRAARDGIWIVPLLVPIAVSFAVVVLFYGEPRYHTPADLSVVILAAAALRSLTSRAPRADSPSD